jgi:hypothetical protein
LVTDWPGRAAQIRHTILQAAAIISQPARRICHLRTTLSDAGRTSAAQIANYFRSAAFRIASVFVSQTASSILSRLHQPPVGRGLDGHGTETMRCSICHQNANFDPGRVPGHPEWHIAPREIAWEGKTLAEICAQIKDPTRNGGRKAEDLIHHIGSDTLVGWAWHPGFGRSAAPGTQKEAGALVDAWVKTGAACPTR